MRRAREVQPPSHTAGQRHAQCHAPAADARELHIADADLATILSDGATDERPAQQCARHRVAERALHRDMRARASSGRERGPAHAQRRQRALGFADGIGHDAGGGDQPEPRGHRIAHRAQFTDLCSIGVDLQVDTLGQLDAALQLGPQLLEPVAHGPLRGRTIEAHEFPLQHLPGRCDHPVGHIDAQHRQTAAVACLVAVRLQPRHACRGEQLPLRCQPGSRDQRRSHTRPRLVSSATTRAQLGTDGWSVPDVRGVLDDSGDGQRLPTDTNRERRATHREAIAGSDIAADGQALFDVPIHARHGGFERIKCWRKIVTDHRFDHRGGHAGVHVGGIGDHLRRGRIEDERARHAMPDIEPHRQDHGEHEPGEKPDRTVRGEAHRASTRGRCGEIGHSGGAPESRPGLPLPGPQESSTRPPIRWQHTDS